MSNMYAGLRRDFQDDPEGLHRCSERLLALRANLADIRKRRTDANLLLATWNIRDFDSNKFKYGPRLTESFYYIAEVLASFDLIAVQEVNTDMSALDKVMRILGRQWDYIVTDTTSPPSGNDERMAFIYNKEKVLFRRVAGEVVLPDGQLIVSPKTVKKDGASIVTEAKQQFARSPFLVAFQAGWFRFCLCTVHIYYGQDSGEQLKRRVAEIEKVVEFFAQRQDGAQDKDRSGNVENYILLGDFNVVSPKHKTMEALTSNRFTIPDAIDGDKVRKKGQHFYDQIAVRVKDPRFKVVGGGMLDVYETVFRAEDMETYKKSIPEKDLETDPKYAAKTPEKLFEKWRTWQMSDHLPLWIDIETDFSDDYLRGLQKP